MLKNSLFQIQNPDPILFSSNHPKIHKPQSRTLSFTIGAMAAASEAKAKEAKLWGGRFEDSVTDAVERFSESVSYDKALYKHDVMGSKAHASMLAHQVFGFAYSRALGV